MLFKNKGAENLIKSEPTEFRNHKTTIAEKLNVQKVQKTLTTIWSKQHFDFCKTVLILVNFSLKYFLHNLSES